MAELVFITVPGTPRVPLPEQGITFGRAPACDLPIEEVHLDGVYEAVITPDDIKKRRDRAAEKANEVAKEATEKATEAAKDAIKEATDKAAESAKEAAKDAIEKAAETASEKASAAAKTVKDDLAK